MRESELANTRIIRFPEVIKRTGLSRNTIYLQMVAGTFPQSFKLGPRAAGWSEIAVDQWVARKIRESVK